MRRTTVRRGTVALTLFTALSAGLVATCALATPARAQAPASTRPRTVAEDLQMFSQVFNHLRVNHADTLDSHALIAAAIAGMLRAADPHSYAVTAVRLSPAKEKAYRDGKLVPVPISFAFHGASPVVAGVRPGSQAATTDILPGDELVAVDGRPVTARTVYGGGVVPDVRLDEPAPIPVWLARLEEAQLPLQWAGAYVSEQAAAYPSLDAFAAAPTLAPGALAAFRAFATAQGSPAPDGAEADAALERHLLLRVAGTKWGAEGYYRVAALLDPEVAAARAAFGDAERILGVP